MAMATATATSSLFQKTLSDLDIAMFCFPKSQPLDPYNCALVSLQLLRLITPVKSNALVPLYPKGVPQDEVVAFMRNAYGIIVSFVPCALDTDISELLFPGFATLLELRSVGPVPLSHSVIYAKGIRGNVYLIDPQTGKIYSTATSDSPFVKPLQDFIKRHNITSLQCVHYTKAYSFDIHGKLSLRMDAILAKVAFETFFKRGQLVESSVLVPSSEVEMTDGGGRRKRLRSRTRKHGRK